MIKQRITRQEIDLYKREILEQSVLVTIPDAARMLSFSESHVRQLVREGALPAYNRKGAKDSAKGTRLLAAELKAYVKSIKVDLDEWRR